MPRPPPPSRSLYVRQASEVPHPLPLQKPLNASMRFEHAHIRQLRSLAVCHAFSVWAGLHGSIIPTGATVMFEIAPVRIFRFVCLQISCSFFKIKLSRVIGDVIAGLVLGP